MDPVFPWIRGQNLDPAIPEMLNLDLETDSETLILTLSHDTDINGRLSVKYEA